MIHFLGLFRFPDAELIYPPVDGGAGDAQFLRRLLLVPIATFEGENSIAFAYILVLHVKGGSGRIGIHRILFIET